MNIAHKLNNLPVPKWLSRYLQIVLFTLLLTGITATSAKATDIATFTPTLIGSASGTYTAGYTVTGSGTGVSPNTTTGDQFCFANTPVTGNIEMVAQVSPLSFSGQPSDYAVAGLMVRDSLNPSLNAASAFISASPGNGVTFTARQTDGVAATTTLGQSLSSVYLKIVVSGTSVAGYQSTDSGVTWTLVGKTTMSMPSVYYVGFAVASQSTSTCSETFANVSLPISVPQRSANMQLWLRGDNGLIYNGSNVTQWVDQSASGNDAVQTTSANQPTKATGGSGINNLPAITLNGTSQYINLPAGFSNYTAGTSIFVVAKLNNATYGDFLNFSSGSVTNSFYMQQLSNSQLRFGVYSGSTASYVTSTSGITTGTNQLLEAVQNGAGTATVYTNGVQGATGTTYNIANTNRTSSCIGQFPSIGQYATGQIAEILVFNTAMTTAQRQAVENYLIGKYSLGGSLPTLAAPVMTPQYSVATTSQTVTITPPAGAIAYYKINSGTYTPYSGPFTVASTATISAYAQAPGFTNSATITGTIQIDPAASAVLQSGLQLWLRGDNGLLSSSGSVTAWNDVSGNNNNATPSTSKPTTTTGPNSLPAVAFSGSTQYFTLPASANYTSGASIFIVGNAGTLTAGDRLLDFGSGSTTSSFGLQELASNGLALFNFNGAAETYVSQTGILTPGSYQIMSSTYNGTNTANVLINSVLEGQNTAMNAMVNTNRTTNSIGRYGGGGYYFTGDMAEIIVFNTALTPAQRLAVEGYLANRYHLYTNAPTITPSGASMQTSSPVTVTITADAGASIYYTTNGTAPTTSSTLYTGPFTIISSTTVQAIAQQPWSGAHSTTTTSLIGVDPMAFNVPTNGLLLWLRADTGVITSSGNVTNWLDLSGNQYNAAAISGSSITLLSNAINGLPAVNVNYSATATNSFTLPSGFANLTQGISSFAVFQSSGNAVVGGFDLYQSSANSDNRVNFTIGTFTNFALNVFNSGGTSATSVSGIFRNGYSILAAVHNGAAKATTYINTIQQNQNTSMNNMSNVSRTYNVMYAPTYSGQSYQMPELLVYSRGLNAFELTAVQGYLMTRYALAPQWTYPTFSPPSATTFLVPTQIAITAPLGATIYASVNGGTFAAYNGPLTVSYGQTIGAYFVLNGATSDTFYAIYFLDAAKWPAPSAPDTNAPTINLQVPTPAQ